MSFSQKVVIVTGGANGIGRATVQKFANMNAAVAIWDLAEIAGQQLAESLSKDGKRAIFQKVSVSDSTAVDAAVAEVIRQWGRVDVLVNNAGIVRDGQLMKVKDGEVQKFMSDDQFSSVIDVNLKGVFACTRAVVPHMIQQNGGVILNASSVVGIYGNFGQTNYVAAKSGVIGMTKVWARELGRYGIRVNAIAPGFIATDMISSVPEKVIEHMVGQTPLGRLGKPEDIANAYAFLASDEAAFINGHVLSVDGGMVLGT